MCNFEMKLKNVQDRQKYSVMFCNQQVDRVQEFVENEKNVW